MSMYRSFAGRTLLSIVCSLGLVGCAGSPLREDPGAAALYMATGGLVGEQRIRQIQQEQRARYQPKSQRAQEENRHAKQAVESLKMVQVLRKEENYAAAISTAQRAIYLTPDNLAAWRTLLDLHVAVEPYPDVLKTTSDKIREDTAMHYGRALLIKRYLASSVSLDAPWNPIVSQWAREVFDRRFLEFIERQGKRLPSDPEQVKRLMTTLTDCMGPTDMFLLQQWVPGIGGIHEDKNYGANLQLAQEARSQSVQRLHEEHDRRALQCARQVGREELYARRIVEEMFTLELLLTAAENAPTAAMAVSIPSSKESTTP